MEKQNLNILPGGILPVIHCSQGDIGRQFQINLYSDNAPYVLDGTEELTLDGHKADNNIFSYSLDPVTGSTITISTEEQMTACAGDVICEIRIFKDDTRIGTCNFIMQIEEGPSNGTPSESTLQALDEIRAEIQQAVEDSEDYADASKAWAVGPNGSGSGSDTNNSKYYSQQSADSATDAYNSADAAHTSELNAADSENHASTSETNAKNWAVGPSGSGSGTDTNNAKYYSTQADSAKSDAVQAKNDAVSAKNDAVSAKNSAESSATDSKNWAVGPSGSGSGTDSNNSKYYAGQASSSASDAINAKTAAEAAQQKIENMTATASQLAEGASPTVTKSEVGGVVNLAFGIPKGDTGATGANGNCIWTTTTAPTSAPAGQLLFSISSLSGPAGYTPRSGDIILYDSDRYTVDSISGTNAITFIYSKVSLRGANGVGVPTGGTAGQVLAKASSSDYDTEWITPTSGNDIYVGKFNYGNTEIDTGAKFYIYNSEYGVKFVCKEIALTYDGNEYWTGNVTLGSTTDILNYWVYLHPTGDNGKVKLPHINDTTMEIDSIYYETFSGPGNASTVLNVKTKLPPSIYYNPQCFVCYYQLFNL